MSRYSDLLKENELVLKRFESQGVDLGKKRWFEFAVSLVDVESCHKVREAFLSEHQVPEGGAFSVVDDPADCLLILELDMKVDLDEVTAIEANLLQASKSFENAEVSWIFKE